MNLPFMTHFPKDAGVLAGKPTDFVGKINASIYKYLKYNLQTYADDYKRLGYGIGHPSDYVPKLHTMRRDEKDRWKVGDDIHFRINMRKPNQNRFAPIVKVKGVQRVGINTVFDLDNTPRRFVIIDGRYLSTEEIKDLAINDGFDSVEDFFEYFKKDFTGKIIHWTNLKY